MILASRRGIPPFIGRHPLWAIARQVPAFHLDFTGGEVREYCGGRLGTFTRPSSVKNVWNGSQFVQVAADVPALQRDPATGLWGYLHEPGATNLYLNSAAPATQTISVAAVQHTLSFYGTGTLTLSGASTAGPLVGTGAEPNRVSLTFTPTAGNLTLTLSGSISRPQLETGPIATSPIITTGSAVTRAVDTWTWTGTESGQIFAALGPSYWAYARGFCDAAGSVSGFVSADNNTNNERWRVAHNGTSASTQLAVSGGTVQANQNHPAGSWPSRTFSKVVGTFALNDFRLGVTGQSIVADTSGTMPTGLTHLRVGSAQAIPQIPSLFITDIALFRGIPSNDLIQQVVA